MIFKRADMKLAKSTVVSSIPIGEFGDEWAGLVGECVEEPSMAIDN